MNQSPNFAHLRVHSEFSLSDGMIRTSNLPSACREQGYDAVAVTDINNVFGLIKFYGKLRDNGIKPILGAEIKLRHDDTLTAMLLLCRNETGYRHLCELLSEIYLHGYDERDHEFALTLAQIQGKTDGLIALTGGQTGLAWQYLQAREADKADALLGELKSLFNGECYVEINRLGRENERVFESQLLELASKHDMPAVATNHACFISEDDFDVHEVRYCISNSHIISDEKRPKPFTPEQYLKSPDEMRETFSDLPELLENAYRVAQRCNVTIDLWNSQLPSVDAEDGLSEAEMLVKLSHEGLEKRLLQRFPDAAEREANRQAYTERLDFELGIINQMGFPGYFLIVADFIGWAKAHDIPVGPGRGSGAGSLVAYALLITDLNPIDYGLLFERFLNPERVSMPDFDIDFCKDRRDEVIDYVTKKYGKEKVAQIATHGTMAAKAAIKDAGRVLGFGYGYVDGIAKLIPSKPGTKLDYALTEEEELKSRYESEDDVRDIIDTALALEGLSKSVGKHAAGVVIAPTKLTDFSALYCESDSDSAVSVQYDKDDIEAAGLVKFDFLGLKTLTIIDHAVKLANVKRQREGHAPLVIEALTFDDPDTFKILNSGKTAAIFQVESDGLTELLKKMQLDKFEQIIDVIALYRPGPLEAGMVDDFVNRRHGRADVTYPHPDLEDTLKDTYGVIVYQEQVMQIARVLAGYSLGQADMLRRAMGKKKPEEMEKQAAMFLEGAAKNGIQADTAKDIFDLMATFAGYGFNKSHSATYAVLTYQTAYLKAHYPAAFMSAVMSSEMNNTNSIVSYIEECRQLGLTVRAPLVNESNYGFSVNEKDEIIYGMGAIKGVGENVLADIIESRQSSGAFSSMDDFFSRPQLLKKINKRVAEALITAGCFDDIEPNRRYLFEHIEDFLQFSAQCAKNAKTGQMDMFGLSMDTPASAENALGDKTSKGAAEWDASTLLLKEKQSLGLFLSGHPIQESRHVIKEMTRHDLKSCFAPMQAQRDMQSEYTPRVQDIFVGGWVIGVRPVNGKFGKVFFVTLDDGTAQREIKFSKQAFADNESRLKEDTTVMILGGCYYSDRNDDFQINGQVVMSVDQARELLVSDVLIRIAEDFQPERPVSETIKSLYTEKGQVKPFIEMTTENAKAKFVLPDTQFDLTPEHYQTLVDTFGEENLSYRWKYHAITGGKEVFKGIIDNLNGVQPDEQPAQA